MYTNILPGNYSSNVATGRHRSSIPGFDLCWFEGSAAINAAPATSWDIINVYDMPALLPATLTEPIWLFATYLDISTAFQGTTGDRLKVATSLGDNAGYVATSQPVDSGGFLQIEDNIRSQAEPFVFTKFTAPVTLKLWLHNNNGAPGGTGLVPAPASPTVLLAPAPLPLKTVRVPVRIEYLQRAEAPDAVDLSPAQMREDSGLPLY